MLLEQKIPALLCGAIESRKISFHSAIKVYRYIAMYTARTRSSSGQLMVRNVSRHLMEATGPGVNNAWTSVLFPTELLYPFGVMPLTLEVIAGLLARLNVAGEFLARAEAADVPATMCTFHRLLLGLAGSNFLDTPTLVGATSLMCDGNVKSFAEAARQRRAPFLFLDIPYEESAAAIHYVKEQLAEALSLIADLTKISYHPEKLREAANNCNQAFALSRKFYTLNRSTDKNLYLGHELANFAFPLHFLFGSERLPKLLQARCQDLVMGQKHNQHFKSFRYPPTVKRLMWLHIVPQYVTPIWNIVDDGLRSRVVCDEYSTLSFEDYDLADPLNSIASRLIRHPSNGPIERRIEHILKVARDYKIDGFVHFSSWGCHQASGNVQLLEEALRGAGYNFLNLNGDPADCRHSSFEQHRTRLEAFLEG